jgi:hypothetical protein
MQLNYLPDTSVLVPYIFESDFEAELRDLTRKLIDYDMKSNNLDGFLVSSISDEFGNITFDEAGNTQTKIIDVLDKTTASNSMKIFLNGIDELIKKRLVPDNQEIVIEEVKFKLDNIKSFNKPLLITLIISIFHDLKYKSSNLEGKFFDCTQEAKKVSDIHRKEGNLIMSVSQKLQTIFPVKDRLKMDIQHITNSFVFCKAYSIQGFFITDDSMGRRDFDNASREAKKEISKFGVNLDIQKLERFVNNYCV